MKRKKKLCLALCILALFALWTASVRLVDVQAIGPTESKIGFATVNGFVHSLTGVNMALYIITDWLGLVPIAFVMGFGFQGLCQWIKRKSILKVDRSILVLGGFYIAVISAFLFFEKFVVNYRPVLIDGILEASYPSSTTMLVLCVMSTTILQLVDRIRNKVLRICMIAIITVFTAFMVVGRLHSGVHWFSDIIGGILLSTGLVLLYDCLANWWK